MTLIKDLLLRKILTPDETIQAQVQGKLVQGRILLSGEISINSELFDSFDSAMDAVLGSEFSEYKSNGIQFWNWYSVERNAWVPIEHARAQLMLIGRPSEIRTSYSHPLRIDALCPQNYSGRIGMTICPGKQGKGLYGGEWRRDLGQDFQQILDWGGTCLITLLEEKEFQFLGVPAFAETVKDFDLNWLHLPIVDMCSPDLNFEARWRLVNDQVFDTLEQGNSIVIHCRGGLGRSGLLAARILAELGENPEASIARVRSARERAIETFEQEAYVLNKEWEKLS